MLVKDAVSMASWYRKCSSSNSSMPAAACLQQRAWPMASLQLTGDVKDTDDKKKLLNKSCMSS
eukprot:1158688-Pelagomonas_calceolata.AAC.2